MPEAILAGGISEDRQHVIVSVWGDEYQADEAAGRLHQVTALFRPCEPAQSLYSFLTWTTITQLANLFSVGSGIRWQPDQYLSAWIIEELLRRTSLNPLRAALETSRLPMPHQVTGAQYIGACGRFLLADEPGTGKTTTALLGMAELAARGENPFPAVIVSPASVIDPWLEEITACFPSWRAIAWRGPKRRQFARGADLYVMSYDAMRNDMKPRGHLPNLQELLKPNTLILDECHGIVNMDTKQSSAARKLAAHTRFAIPMSGTPIRRHVGDFWASLNVIDSRSFPDKQRYIGRYCLRHSQDYGAPDVVDGLNPLTEPEFRTVMTGTMRRVAKMDVLTDLPPKSYSTRVVDVPAAWRAAYDEMEEDMLAHLPDHDDLTVIEAMSVLAKMMRLNQLAQSACDVTKYPELNDEGEEEEKIRVTMKEPSWKVDVLMEILSESEGDPVVVFAQFRQLVDLAEQRARKAGYKTGLIVGGQTATERTRNRTAFQNGELDALFVTTGAGGVGLTLTRAATVVFLQRPWSYVEASQAEDRLHRRGQERPVNVIDIIARNTIDSRIRQSLRGKARQLSELVQDRRLIEEVLGGSE